MSLITGKAILLIVLLVAIYSVSSYFGVVPQSVKDSLSWFDRNTTELLVVVCFALVCYVILVLNRKKREE